MMKPAAKPRLSRKNPARPPRAKMARTMKAGMASAQYQPATVSNFGVDFLARDERPTRLG